VSFDALAFAAVLVVLTLGAMRLLYGAWPWEAGKTWYHTRYAVEALRRARRDRTFRQLENTLNASKDRFADRVTPSRLAAGDASGDSFDRGLMVQDNSPSEATAPPEVPPTAKQPTLVHPISSIEI